MPNTKDKSSKSWFIAICLATCLGLLGAHRFYVGKIGTGILQVLTLGGFGIWTFIDWTLLLFRRFRDHEGNLLRPKAGGFMLFCFLYLGITLLGILFSFHFRIQF